MDRQAEAGQAAEAEAVVSTADILALGEILQGFAWPCAVVIAAWMFRDQLRLSAPPKPPPAPKDDGVPTYLDGPPFAGGSGSTS